MLVSPIYTEYRGDAERKYGSHDHSLSPDYPTIKRNLSWLTKSIITQATRRRKALFKAHKRSKSTSVRIELPEIASLLCCWVVAKPNTSANWGPKILKTSGYLSNCKQRKRCSIPPMVQEVSDNSVKASLLNNFFYDCLSNKSPPLTYTLIAFATWWLPSITSVWWSRCLSPNCWYRWDFCEDAEGNSWCYSAQSYICQTI